MSRANKRETEIRAMLETIGAHLAAIHIRAADVALRVGQARERSGLSGLLIPALDDLQDVVKEADGIGVQVRAALAKLTE